VAADPWQGSILDGTKEGSKCVQFSGLFNRAEGEEDCLHLNVYTHNVITLFNINRYSSQLTKNIYTIKSKPDEGFLKPVMVWIHGGAFMEGSGNGEDDFYGPGYMMINYRLTALGMHRNEKYNMLIYKNLLIKL